MPLEDDDAEDATAGADEVAELAGATDSDCCGVLEEGGLEDFPGSEVFAGADVVTGAGCEAAVGIGLSPVRQDCGVPGPVYGTVITAPSYVNVWVGHGAAAVFAFVMQDWGVPGPV